MPYPCTHDHMKFTTSANTDIKYILHELIFHSMLQFTVAHKNHYYEMFQFGQKNVRAYEIYKCIYVFYSTNQHKLLDIMGAMHKQWLIPSHYYSIPFSRTMFAYAALIWQQLHLHMQQLLNFVHMKLNVWELHFYAIAMREHVRLM